MCGIVGYVGVKQAAPILLAGLSKLEYRGYDSAGLAVRDEASEHIEVVKAKGRLKNLMEMTDSGNAVHGLCGIGHTRWATHGEPSTVNAHPQYTREKRVVLVHNGNIENYQEIKESLLKKGYTFASQTDTEVAAALLDSYYADAANTFYRFRADVKGNGKALTCGGLSYTEEDLRIEPKAALVLWYSCLQTSYLPWIQASPVVLSSVKFKKDGYIYFDTPETFVNGNVVIVAIDKELGYDQIEADADKRITNAEVLWSWNIVFSEGYDPDAAENWIVKGGYTWMNRDLGALIDPEQAYIGGQLNNVALASTTGNCYQWGRKDPFPGLPDYTSVQVSYMTGLWFAPAYTPIPALDRGTFEAWGREAHHQIIGNTKATVAIDINTALGTGYVSQDAFDLGRANPHLWLYKNENYLTDKAGLAAWGNPSKDAHGVKTIYDPCPPGWKVMSSQAWIALTDNETPDAVVATTMRGILLDNKWYFPLTGGAQHVRNSDGGSNGYTGSCGVEVCTAYYMDGPDYSPWGRVGAFKAAPNYKEGDSVTCQSQNTYSDRGASVRCIRIDE